MADFFTFSDLGNWAQTGAGLQPAARLAVIGDPIAHSKSPQMHNPALQACGIRAQYVRVQVPVGSVGKAFRLFAANNFIGVNITIPHKFEALAGVEVVNELAATLGAVNTLAIRDGKLHGHNTDGPGFLRSVREVFDADVRDLRVMILGAGGGAGRAVAVQCALSGCQKIILANRTPEKALRVMHEIRQISRTSQTTLVGAAKMDHEHVTQQLHECDLIVNATSLGMRPDDAPLLPAGALESRHLVFDMVYKPAGQLTALGQAARDAGARYVDGATLLLHQGAISFEHWFDRPAPLAEMRAGLARALAS